MTRRDATLAVVAVLLFLVAAAIFLGRPESPDTGGGSDASVGAGTTSPSSFDSSSESGWWDRIRRRLGLGGSGPGLRGSGDARASGGDSRWLRAVDGIVVDAQGLPVANAEVRRLSHDKPRRAPDRVRSGADGTFRIEVKAEDYSEDHLEARDPGRRSRRARTTERPLRLQLLPEARLEIVVRDARTKEHVSRADVAIEPGPIEGSATHETSTDARGRVEVEAAPLVSYTVDVRAAGYAPARVRIKSTAGKSEVVHVELGRGGVLRGTVRDHEGIPVDAVRVVADVWFGAFDGWDSGRLSRRVPIETRTDREGRFEFLHVPAQTLRLGLDVKADDGRRALVSVRALAEGEERSVEVRLPEPIRIEGRVVGLDSAPIAEGTVELGSDSEAPPVRIGPDGAFSFDVPWQAGAMSLAYEDDSGARQRSVAVHPGSGGGLHRVTIVVPPRVVATPDREIEVRVLAANGSPVLRARVSAGKGWETTNQDGVAVVPVADEATVEVRVRPPEGVEQATTVTVPAVGPVEFRLSDGVVAGRVLRHDGTPSRSLLTLGRRRQRSVSDALVSLFSLDVDPSDTALADAAGRFRFGGVGDGEHVLFYRESDAHPWSRRVVRAGESDLTLHLPSASDLSRSFEVTVVGAESARKLHLMGMSLEQGGSTRWSGALYPVPGSPGTFRSEPDGNSAAIVPGVYDVTIQPGADGRPEKLVAQSIGPGVHRWTVRWSPSSRLVGTVRAPDGRTLPGVTVLGGPAGWQERGEPRSLFATTDAEGRYELDGVVPGALEISLRPPGWAWSVRVVELSSDPVTQLDLTAERGGTIEIWPGDGRLLPEDASVTLRRIGTGGASFERSQGAWDDPNDPWTSFEDVPPGRLLWTVEVEEREVHRGEVAVEAGKTAVVVVPP
jgi:hypothetical protein